MFEYDCLRSTLRISLESHEPSENPAHPFSTTIIHRRAPACNDAWMRLPDDQSEVSASVADLPRRHRHGRPSPVRQTIHRIGSRLEPLFPMTPEPKSGRRLMAWLYVPALVGLSVVLLLRQSGVGATNTMWAEDGAVFYRDALTHSAASNLVRTYNGYIQLLPRLIFEVIRFVPLSDVAFVVAATGAALVAGLSLVVFRSSASHIRSPLLRSLLVAAMILLPVSPNELLDNVVNVSWWMIFASFWLLIWRPRSWSGRAVAGIVCFLAAASDPIVTLLLPITILRVVALRRASENTATIGLLAGIFFQLAVIATSHSSSSYQTGGSWLDLVRTFGVRIGLAAVTGATRDGQPLVRSSVAGIDSRPRRLRRPAGACRAPARSSAPFFCCLGPG